MTVEGWQPKHFRPAYIVVTGGNRHYRAGTMYRRLYFDDEQGEWTDARILALLEECKAASIRKYGPAVFKFYIGQENESRAKRLAKDILEHFAREYNGD
ncbi:MAG: hypothetical protein WC372_06900 [Candidatus Neomarinimicrobiota bacterium]|jgi:hypothetical protein